MEATSETPTLQPYKLVQSVDLRDLPVGEAEHKFALDRAARKLKRIRDNPATEPDYGPLRLRIPRFLWLYLAAIVPVIAGLCVLTLVGGFRWHLVVLIGGLIVGVCANVVAFGAIAMSDRTATPKSALSGFMLGMVLKRPEFAWKLVAEADHDDTLRRLQVPWFKDSGTTVSHLPISSPAELSAYWEAAIGANTPAWQHTSTVIRERTLAPDLVHMVVQLRFTRGRLARGLLWGIAFLVGAFGGLASFMLFVGAIFGGFRFLERHGLQPWVVAVAAVPLMLGAAALLVYGFAKALDELGGHYQTCELQKLMVRVHGRWKLFAAEVQGPEETDLTWLDQAPPGPQPS